jgi:hypothetical protein
VRHYRLDSTVIFSWLLWIAADIYFLGLSQSFCVWFLGLACASTFMNLSLWFLSNGGLLWSGWKLMCLVVQLNFMGLSPGYLGSRGVFQRGNKLVWLIVCFLEELVYVQQFALNAQFTCHVLAQSLFEHAQSLLFRRMHVRVTYHVLCSYGFDVWLIFLHYLDLLSICVCCMLSHFG